MLLTWSLSAAGDEVEPQLLSENAPRALKIGNNYARIQIKSELLDKIVCNIEMLNADWEFYVIFLNPEGDPKSSHKRGIVPYSRKSGVAWSFIL